MTREQHLAAAVEAHRRVNRALSAVGEETDARTEVFKRANADDVTWDDLAAALGVTRQRILQMAKTSEERRLQRSEAAASRRARASTSESEGE